MILIHEMEVLQVRLSASASRPPWTYDVKLLSSEIVCCKVFVEKKITALV